MSYTEGPSNWLSKIIDENRKAIVRFIPFFEQKAEQAAILAAIKAHPKGQPLLSHANLADVVWASLGVANEYEREAKKRPMPNLSPSIKASLFIFEELGLPQPEYES
jgi:hypothetical protein